MYPVFRLKSRCPSMVAVDNMRSQPRAFTIRPRPVPPPVSYIHHIGNNIDNAAQLEPVQYDDESLPPGQYDDAHNDPYQVSMNAAERSVAIAQTAGDSEGRATPSYTIPLAVVTPAPTPRRKKHVAIAANHDLAIPDLDSSTSPSYDGSPKQVLLGSGGHTCKNAGNIAATDFFCSRTPTYKKLKANEKKPFVKRVCKEFMMKGYTFWVKHEGRPKLASERRILKYAQQKLREGKITPQDRKEKNARREENQQNLDNGLDLQGSMMN